MSDTKTDTKTEGQKLEERLSYKRKNVWEKVDEDYIKRHLISVKNIKVFSIHQKPNANLPQTLKSWQFQRDSGIWTA